MLRDTGFSLSNRILVVTMIDFKIQGRGKTPKCFPCYINELGKIVWVKVDSIFEGAPLVSSFHSSRTLLNTCSFAGILPEHFVFRFYTSGTHSSFRTPDLSSVCTFSEHMFLRRYTSRTHSLTSPKLQSYLCIQFT